MQCPQAALEEGILLLLAVLPRARVEREDARRQRSGKGNERRIRRIWEDDRDQPTLGIPDSRVHADRNDSLTTSDRLGSR
jgi:hypothetical protein